MNVLDIATDSPFGRENLPYGVFSPGSDRPRVGVRVGDLVIDLAAFGDPVFSPDQLASATAAAAAAEAEAPAPGTIAVRGAPLPRQEGASRANWGHPNGAGAQVIGHVRDVGSGDADNQITVFCLTRLM